MYFSSSRYGLRKVVVVLGVLRTCLACLRAVLFRII